VRSFPDRVQEYLCSHREHDSCTAYIGGAIYLVRCDSKLWDLLIHCLTRRRTERRQDPFSTSSACLGHVCDPCVPKVGVRMVAHATSLWSAGSIVLKAVSAEKLNGSVVHSDWQSNPYSLQGSIKISHMSSSRLRLLSAVSTLDRAI